MALPFILGLAVGAGAIVAFNKSDKIKKSACSLFKKSKDVASDSLGKVEETVSDVKQTINATAECIKEKKEQATLSENKESEEIEEFKKNIEEKGTKPKVEEDK